MATHKTDKIEFVFGAIIVAFTIIEIVFIALVSIIAIPLIFLSDFIEKKVFRVKEVDWTDDPEWYRSGGRGSIF